MSAYMQQFVYDYCIPNRTMYGYKYGDIGGYVCKFMEPGPEQGSKFSENPYDARLELCAQLYLQS